MGIFRRKSSTTTDQPPQQSQTLDEKFAEAKQIWTDGQSTLWHTEQAKYQAKLDEMIAAGKGESAAADRVRKVIARCERKIAEGK